MYRQFMRGICPIVSWRIAGSLDKQDGGFSPVDGGREDYAGRRRGGFQPNVQVVLEGNGKK